MKEEQMRENGYPRPGNKNGMAKIYKAPPAAPNSITDRYCRRCGKVFSLEHYDENAVDECNYHPKSPGFRRGKFCCVCVRVENVFFLNTKSYVLTLYTSTHLFKHLTSEIIKLNAIKERSSIQNVILKTKNKFPMLCLFRLPQ